MSVQRDHARNPSTDVAVVGAGAVGLSIAYELAGQGASVSVFDQGPLGQEASWAGAGMLPPAKAFDGASALERIRAQSFQLWPEWTARMREATGLDNGFRRCGGLELMPTDSAGEPLAEALNSFQRAGIEVERVGLDELRHLEPHLSEDCREGLYLPEFCQVRNPRHLKMLIAACHQLGVQLHPGVSVFGWEGSGERIRALQTIKGRCEASHFVVCGGAWSGGLLSSLGCHLPLEPVRGQIVLVSAKSTLARHVIEVGKRYLVPRGDGRILIGSTEERVGFLKQNTAEGVSGLIEFGRRLVPMLGQAVVERVWSGLRPGTGDGAPFLGPVPGYQNVFVAAGHFREGLLLAPATASIISRMVLGREIDIPWRELSCERIQNRSAAGQSQ